MEQMWNEKTCKKFGTKVSVGIWESHSTQYGRDEVALKTTSIENVKFSITTRTGCQYVLQAAYTTAKT